ncbi:MAG: hypothetical protein MJE77_30250 [Proteobacteria bacterium]|nr:hypothetical protein [Pseudomonadota bacterium]
MRGLSLDPEHRFVDMRKLLDALDVRARRRRLLWAAALSAVAAAAIAASLIVGQTPKPCAAVADSINGVWNQVRRSELSRVFAGTATPFAASTWRQVRDRIDRYVEQWKQGRRR